MLEYIRFPGVSTISLSFWLWLLNIFDVWVPFWGKCIKLKREKRVFITIDNVLLRCIASGGAWIFWIEYCWASRLLLLYYDFSSLLYVMPFLYQILTSAKRKQLVSALNVTVRIHGVATTACAAEICCIWRITIPA